MLAQRCTSMPASRISAEDQKRRRLAEKRRAARVCVCKRARELDLCRKLSKSVGWRPNAVDSGWFVPHVRACVCALTLHDQSKAGGAGFKFQSGTVQTCTSLVLRSFQIT
jgi:hypothetical protein